MKRSLMLAALAAFSTLAVTGSAFAETQFRIDDETICKLLEAAHESNCEEFEVVRSFERVSSFLPPASLVESDETTGSIGADSPFVPGTIPVKR